MAGGSGLEAYFRRLKEFSVLRWTGRVTKVVGNLVESEGPFCSVGEGCAIVTEGGQTFSGEIIGFRGRTVLSMPLQRPSGIRFGDRLITRGTRPSLRVGPDMLGRVIEGTGRLMESRFTGRKNIGHCKGSHHCRWTASQFASRWDAECGPSMG